ncbi:hypothetical protein AVEN_267495-1 [Araneus ventricosus]|uniref:RNase H type-1 domain-containing protein n=1 Tax=Araneus ventricosus TaxID=182803 RepID=A0A4Y2QWQ0_ARAVE|nr:hypothetical protein AVEN_49031-1 [Araneus ventricosus]GBN67564.1 hypothetical protein AVEN_267495-1 [Araneus ventricosus]
MLNKISNHVSQDTNTSILIIHNNRIISNPQRQSNLFVNFFALRIQHEPIPLDYNGVYNSNLNHPIQIQETIKAIQNTKNSTPGADNIPAAWFKRLNNQQVHTLTASFQEIFITTNIPQQWKHSLIIPIPKPSKDKTIISSYRPIALTSVGAKIFERIPTKRISTFLLTQKKIPHFVHGFLPLRDNQLAIYKIQSNILESHQRKDFFIGINLDIKSAYDSVYIDGLIQKCLHIGITGYIVKFIHQFLQDRVLQWSATHLKICDVIQTTALRTAIGLPIWTPNIILLKLAAQETLSGKIKRLATQFFLKHIAYGAHSPLYRNDGTQSVKLTNKDSSALDQLLSDFNIGIDHIIKFPNTCDCLNIKCKIHLQSLMFQNKSLPKTTIESLFEDTIRINFSNFFLIATDTSKSQQITSIAGTSITNSFAYRLQHINSIFSAEALVLCQALDELPNGEDNLLLLTDNLSVLQANLSIKSHKVILRLAAKIATREKFHENIDLLWTPGHAGMKWNEKADTLARRVSESDLNIQWVTAEDIITQLKVHSGNQTDATYRESKYYATLGYIPSIQTTAPWLKNRREDIIIARIISRMIITSALLHRFGLNDNPLCSMCKCDNSIEHILLYCRKYSLIRQSLCRHLNINLAVLSTFKSFISIICSSQPLLKFFDIF